MDKDIRWRGLGGLGVVWENFFDSKIIYTMLHIKNVNKIIGKPYSEWLDISDVVTYDDYYEFVLLSNNGNQQIEYILIRRQPESSGHYVMEYRGETLPLKITEFDTIEKIIICMQTI